MSSFKRCEKELVKLKASVIRTSENRYNQQVNLDVGASTGGKKGESDRTLETRNPDGVAKVGSDVVGAPKILASRPPNVERT